MRNFLDRFANATKLLVITTLSCACTMMVSVTENTTDDVNNGDSSSDVIEQTDDTTDSEFESGTTTESNDIESLRVLFVMDMSASLQCTDPHHTRIDAMMNELNLMREQPGVSFGFMGFSDQVVYFPFTDAAAFEDGFENYFAEHIDGPATDFQGALTAIREVLREDIETVPLA
jgi:hypothetical protein